MPRRGDLIATTLDVNGDVKGQTATYTAAGAIIERSGTVFIGSGGALAMTLSDPADGDDGKVLVILALTAQAHTVTAAGGVPPSDDTIMTYSDDGESVTLVAMNGKWIIAANNGVALS